MFNINIVWNPNHVLSRFDKSLFTVLSHHYEYVDDINNTNDKNYVLTIKYKSNLKINPVIVKHPRYGFDCMALVFVNVSENEVNELVIDTRIVRYCDFVDYIRTDNINDIIERQEKYWNLFQTFGKYCVDMIIEESNDNYIFTFTHGKDVEIKYENNTFILTKTFYRMMELMAYITTHKIPSLDIKIIERNL